MANEDFFKRVIVPVRQRPISDDLNRMQARQAETMRLITYATFGESWSSSPSLDPALRFAWFPPSGFVGSGFLVGVDSGAPPFGISIYPGIGLAGFTDLASVTDYDTASGLDWANSPGAPLALSAVQPLTIPAPPAAGHSRIDVIEVRANYQATDPATVGIFNTTTRVFDPTVKNKGFEWDLASLTGSVTSPTNSTAAISYKKGVDFAGGIAGATEPAASPGYYKIARINLDGAVAAITQDLIADLRRPLLPQGMLRVGGRVETAGLVGGLGLISLFGVELPPGVVVAAAVQSGVAPAGGVSYTTRVYVIGGDLTPRNGALSGGSVQITSNYGSGPRCPAVTAHRSGAFLAADLAILDGTDPNWTPLPAAATYPLGQPFYSFDALIRHPAGSALQNNETFDFSITLSLA